MNLIKQEFNRALRIFLFTPFFCAQTDCRRRELEECLLRNASCNSIEKIFLLIDDGSYPETKSPKIEFIRISSKPTYKQWLELTQKVVTNGISVLANSDISFDSSIEKLKDIFQKGDRFVAISRYEKHGEEDTPHPNPHWSQDVWAIRAGHSIPATILKSADFPLGVPRCDNKIAYIFSIHGWQIFNPLHFVKCTHHHESGLRSYEKKKDTTVIGGMAYVHPCEDLNIASTLELEIWAKQIDRISKTSLNKSLPMWLMEEQDGLHNWSGPEVEKIANSREIIRFLKEGTPLFKHNTRFKALILNETIMLQDALLPGSAVKISNHDFQSLRKSTSKLLAHWIPPIVNTFPLKVKDRPGNPGDLWFWQYPCITEKQALENHADLEIGSNFNAITRTIHTYLGLPWATFIDKKQTPDRLNAILRSRILGFKSLAEQSDWHLAVHTVCQSIHWRRLLDSCVKLGITDLHVSHFEKSIATEFPDMPLRIHSWPLYAVNVESTGRKTGLVVGKPVQEKKFLASFIGAHMKHYRSDVRLRLLQLASKENSKDIFVEVGNEWNFNQAVFKEQVEGVALSASANKASLSSAQRYNEILSDSIFSICPEGAGPNTLRFWESLAIGSIPLVISDQWIPPRVEVNGISLDDCYIRISTRELDSMFSLLRSFTYDKIAHMQRNCIDTYKKASKLCCFDSKPKY